MKKKVSLKFRAAPALYFIN